MIPEPADVISYSYLWAREAANGQEEGAKDRPAVVILAKIVNRDQTQLLVAPITHSPPELGCGVLIPPTVQRHLGLDEDPSWIITTELNRFIWPGPDIRIVKGGDTPHQGAIPAKLFDQVKMQISSQAKLSKVAVSKRTD
jgi:hypothetical protein